MKKKLVILSGFALSLAPIAVLAQTTGLSPAICGSGTVSTNNLTIQTIICKMSDILGALLPLLIAIGVIYFVWGVVSYVIGDDEEAKEKGRNRIIYGIIGLAVIIGMWGLVKILTNTFLGSTPNTQNITFPTVPY